MPRSRVLILLLMFVVCCEPSAIWAAKPSDNLLPATTKGYLSIKDVESLAQHWNATQLGQLANDPIMQPFVDDLKEQIKTKLGQTGARLGINLEDLKGLPGGEFCIAIVQPENDKKLHAIVIIVDITGHEPETRELLQRITNNQIEKGAQRNILKVQGVEISAFTFPKKKDQAEAGHAYYFLHQETLVVVNHLNTAKEILSRFSGDSKDILANVTAYSTSMERSQGVDSSDSQIRWYVDPFGYAETVRAMNGGRKKRGTDLLKVLANQGFNAVKGIGGQIRLNDGNHELVHRSFVYAPLIDGKYKLAMRMLDFPNTSDHQPLRWVPRDLAAQMSLNWKIKESFEFLGSLVDEFAGDQGVWEDVLESIKRDPNGPRVDLRAELMQHAGERITLVTDYRLPIGPKSERIAVAIQITDEVAVAKAIEKIMDSDPNSKKHEIEGRVVWEIVNDQLAADVESIEIEGAGFTSVNDDVKSIEVSKNEEKPTIPNSAVAVVEGHLLLSTHVDFIRDLLHPRDVQDSLEQAVDYQLVDAALNKLGAGSDCIRYFTRTDEAYRPTYELIRMGRMPESETALGQLLNKLLAPDDEDAVREQQLDGGKLPPFDAVRRYLGPAGFFSRSEADGWTIVGCLLTK